MLVVATEDKRLNLWRRAITNPTSTSPDPAASIPGDSARREAASGREEGQRRRERGETGGEEGEKGAGFEAWSMIGMREVPKKPTGVLFAKTPPIDEGVDGQEVLVISDKCGDAYAAPLQQPASTLKHLLGHTAMTITSMVSLKGGRLLATGDRAEHIRISQFPRTSIVHTYLLGHKDFVSAIAAIPAAAADSVDTAANALLLSGGGDGMVALWNADTGEMLSMLSVREACQELADEADAQGDRRSAELETATETETGTHTTAAEGDHSESPNGGGDSGDEYIDDGDDDGGNHSSGGRVEEVAAGGSGGRSTAGAEGGGRDSDVVGDGVPVSICCSEDGGTVAVVVSGLPGLLLLRLACDEGAGDGRGGSTRGMKYRLSPLARLQLPTVPIQAGYMGDGLIVALPSLDLCLQAFRVAEDCADGAVEVEVNGEDGVGAAAARACAAINDKARSEGLLLKPAVAQKDAADSLAGGLRKHKGTRSAGKSSTAWNNFSKR
ncbi:unnamed protein product [Sphacelaria rigidula]